MEVYAVNPRHRENPFGGELLALTNPRRRRTKKNPYWGAGKSGAWTQFDDDGNEIYVTPYSTPSKRTGKLTHNKKERTTVAKKGRKLKHTLKAYKRRYGKAKGTSLWKLHRTGKKTTTRKHRRYHKRASAISLLPGKRKKHGTIRMRFQGTRPMKVTATNPRRRRHRTVKHVYHRRRRSYRLNPVIARLNPRRRGRRSFPKIGVSKDVLMRAAMVAAGFFGHRLLSNILTQKLPQWTSVTVPQEVVDVALPVGTYLFLKSKYGRGIKYGNEIVIGASVSAINRLAKKWLPESIGQYLGADEQSILRIPSQISGYQVGDVYKNGVLGGYQVGSNDPFLLGSGDGELDE